MDWAPYLREVHETYEQIIRTLLGFVDVVLITPSDSDVRESFLEESRSARHTLYRISDIELNDTWIRDYGPLSLSNETGVKMVLKFRFNGWGQKFASDRDNLFFARFRAAGYFNDSVKEVDGSNIVFEGGGIDINGRGEAISTLPLFTYPNRNAFSEFETFEFVKLYSGATRMDVLDLEPMDGDDTDGHVDTMVRFVSDDSILSCVPLSADELRHLHAGVHYLPVPDPVVWEGETKPATYANFLITNGAILVPTYGAPQDEEALEVIREFAGSREVIGIDCRVLVRQNGSLHCATMQVAKGFLNKSKLPKA